MNNIKLKTLITSTAAIGVVAIFSACNSTDTKISAPITTPSYFIPKKIESYIAQKYPTAKIVGYSKEYKTVFFIPTVDECVVKLDNGTDVKFHSDGSLKLE